jgi:hypothetical protein
MFSQKEQIWGSVYQKKKSHIEFETFNSAIYYCRENL